MELDVATADMFVSPEMFGLHVDLSDVTFALPGGIVALACLVREAHRKREEVRVTPPASRQVARYVSRMGLGDVFVSFGAPNPLPPVGRWDTDTLIECLWSDDSAVDDLAVLINNRLEEAAVDAFVTDVITTSVYEMVSNVRTHADAGGGFICAQTYQRGAPSERIEVAVGDNGCGVPASIARRHSPANDRAALVMAVSESVSGLSPGRGLGLHYVARDITDAGGRVTMRSGTASLHVSPGGRSCVNSALVPGTLVAIRVPVGHLGRRGDQ